MATIETVIEKAKITPWAGLTAEEKQLFTDYFITSSQNLDKIPKFCPREHFCHGAERCFSG